jgi:uncharacterized NAD(P)/FAD-binding protein YdhS
MDASVIIIGSGYSAAALVAHLTHAGLPTREVLVIGPGALGTGQAYGCTAVSFRLNVRENLQRLWPDQPEHFANWAAAYLQDPAAHDSAGHFYRRYDFARYLEAQLAAIPDAGALRRVTARVTSIAAMGRGWIVTCDNAAQYRAARLVLATGNPDPQWPGGIKPGDAPSLVRAPWRGDWLADVRPKAHVCVVGSGLTAMDVLYALVMQGHQGPISLLSPQGLLPPRQAAWVAGSAYDWPTGLRGSGFIRTIRQHLGTRRWHEQECQERFEALRVHINRAWQALPAKDRIRLRRRLGWLWSLLRFRAGPQTAVAAKAMHASGQLNIINERFSGLAAAGGGRWQVQLCSGEELTADIVANCTGVGRDKLIDSMIAAGQITAMGSTRQPLVTPELRVVAADSQPYHTLFCVGPATGLALGDVVGATSIAQQAAQLVQTLLANR